MSIGRSFWPCQTLGVTVVGGLVFSQLMTHCITPVIYTYLEWMQLWLKRDSQKGPRRPSSRKDRS